MVIFPKDSFFIDVIEDRRRCEEKIGSKVVENRKMSVFCRVSHYRPIFFIFDFLHTQHFRSVRFYN